MTCVCGKSFCWTCLKPWVHENPIHDCVSVSAQQFTFSSIDHAASGREQDFARALKYNFKSLEARKLCRKLKINKILNKYRYVQPAESSKLIIVKNAIHLLEDSYKLVEMMIVAQVGCPSRSNSLALFVDCLALSLGNIHDTLFVPHISQVQVGAVIAETKRAHECISKLRKFGLY